MTRPAGARCWSTVLDPGPPDLVGHLEHGAEPVGLGLVRTDDPEVAVGRVGRHHVAQPAAEHPGRLGAPCAGLGDLDRVGRGSRAAPGHG